MPGRAGGEDPHQPLDRLRQPGLVLVLGILAGKQGEHVPELAAGGTQEAPGGVDPHQHLGDAEGDDLGVGQPAAGDARPARQEVVGRAVATDEQQVEVGVHRGLRVDGVRDTADFDWSLAPRTGP